MGTCSLSALGSDQEDCPCAESLGACTPGNGAQATGLEFAVLLHTSCWRLGRVVILLGFESTRYEWREHSEVGLPLSRATLLGTTAIGTSPHPAPPSCAKLLKC